VRHELNERKTEIDSHLAVHTEGLQKDQERKRHAVPNRAFCSVGDGQPPREGLLFLENGCSKCGEDGTPRARSNRMTQSEHCMEINVSTTPGALLRE